MSIEAIEKRILSYFEGELSPEDTARLKVDIQQEEAFQALFEEYAILYREIGQESWSTPNLKMTDRFNSWLTDQQADQFQSQKKGKIRQFPEWIAAAAIGLLLIGASLGVLLRKNQQQQQEIALLATEMKKMQQDLALAKLEKESASQRIQAINVLQSEQDPKTDEIIVEALLQRIEYDENINVRIAASEALMHFPERATIEGLISLLKLETDPRVQLTIIEVLVQLKAEKAIPSLEEMLLQDSVAPVVKEQAAKSIEILM